MCTNICRESEKRIEPDPRDKMSLEAMGTR